MAFVDLLGRSLLEHTIHWLLSAQVKAVSLVVHPDVATHVPTLRDPLGNPSVRVAEDASAAVAEVLDAYWKSGLGCAVVLKLTAYVEADLADLLDFHQQAERTVTRASDRDGPLDLWVVNCNPAAESVGSSSTTALFQRDFLPASYFVKEYVRRISGPEDFRQLVTDTFVARCHLMPAGEQLRPGIWADRGVQIRRGARIVGPAYLGARCTIGERVVITRFSNIENDSYIDYGTVIENSSVLPNTYVGILLDVRRSIVHGNRLLSLERGVLVEVSDSRLLRANGTVKQSRRMPVLFPRQAHGSSMPQDSVVDHIRSINTSTEFES